VCEWARRRALVCRQDLFLDTHGVKLGFMSAFVKAAGDALQKVRAARCYSRPDWFGVCCSVWLGI
jgi:hypothetical protein